MCVGSQKESPASSGLLSTPTVKTVVTGEVKGTAAPRIDVGLFVPVPSERMFQRRPETLSHGRRIEPVCEVTMCASIHTSSFLFLLHNGLLQDAPGAGSTEDYER